jgi:hypothetical protein
MAVVALEQLYEMLFAVSYVSYVSYLYIDRRGQTSRKSQGSCRRYQRGNTKVWSQQSPELWRHLYVRSRWIRKQKSHGRCQRSFLIIIAVFRVSLLIIVLDILREIVADDHRLLQYCDRISRTIFNTIG